MVKGVNKQIIEISDIDNLSFERAILFVRPESQRLDSESLHEHASGFLASASLRAGFYHRRKIGQGLVCMLIGAALGFSAAVMVFLV